jgi:hypothetical protein
MVVSATVMEDIREVVHRNPVWRSRSDFIIAATIEGGGDFKTEQIWVRRDGELFEICCIPFFIYNLALGDLVSADSEYLITGVVRASGRYVFRVWFGDSPNSRAEVSVRLAEMGSLLEWSSDNLVAVDAADIEHAQLVADYLNEREQEGQLTYETGR